MAVIFDQGVFLQHQEAQRELSEGGGFAVAIGGLGFAALGAGEQLLVARTQRNGSAPSEDEMLLGRMRS